MSVPTTLHLIKRCRHEDLAKLRNNIETTKEPEQNINNSYHSNPMYQKLLNFRNLQEQQKKRFTVDDLLKW
jgi:hypothetical protein